MKNWKETETGWIDELTGLEWEKEFKVNLNQYEAETWAKEKGKRLPTRAEFIEAEKHGIRELPDMKWKRHWFWSSTVLPVLPAGAFVFDGDSGSADGHFRSYSSSYGGARCVSQAMAPICKSESEKIEKAKALLKQALEVLAGGE